MLTHTPDGALSIFTTEYQAWANCSCTKSLGPSSLSNFVVRESATLYETKTLPRKTYTYLPASHTRSYVLRGNQTSFKLRWLKITNVSLSMNKDMTQKHTALVWTKVIT